MEKSEVAPTEPPASVMARARAAFVRSWTKWKASRWAKGLTTGGAIVAIGATAIRLYAEEQALAVIHAVGGAFRDWLVGLPSHPLGFWGVLLCVWFAILAGYFGVLVTMDYARTWRAERSGNAPAGVEALKRDLMEALRAMEIERHGRIAAYRELAKAREDEENAQADLARHLDVMQFGERCLPGAAPLNASDLLFLTEAMAELQPFATAAGGKAEQRLSGILSHMSASPKDAAQHWLAEFVQEQILAEAMRTRSRLEVAVTKNTDSREALASFHRHYQGLQSWTERLMSVSGVDREFLEIFEADDDADKQYSRALAGKIELRQFAAVREFIGKRIAGQ